MSCDVSFYEGEEQLLLGVLEDRPPCGLCEKMAETAETEELREHYIQVAEVNEALLNHPPADAAGGMPVYRSFSVY